MKENHLKNISLKNLNLSENFKNLLNNNLNFEQLIAVKNLNGFFLIIAGAGSGKTRVIIYRTILLLELQIPSQNILILTFTRKATIEIRNRVSTFLSNSNINIETFHSLAYKSLKKYGQNRFFKVLTPEEAIILAKKSNYYRDISDLFSENFIERLLLSSKEIFFNKSIFKTLDKKSKFKIKIFLQDFEDIKKRENFCTFDDLLINFYNLLNLDLIPLTFQYIMVDEYQDTDKMQVEILKLLSKSGNLMVVGDDYQSIYNFKGTSMENITNFYRDFPMAKISILKRNYRSTYEILQLANEFSKSLKYCYYKKLENKNISLKKPTLNIFRDHSQEVLSILNKIKNILKDNPKDTISILFRNHIYMENFIKIFKSLNMDFYIYPNSFLESLFDESIFINTHDASLTLLTIHGSKGLEWDYVFIPLLLDGVIPTSIGDYIDFEEEKRLFYVALTRAKKELFLSYPLSFYSDYGFFNTPSIFIESIDSMLINIKRG